MEDLACLEKEGKREVQFFLIKSEKREKMRLSEELIYLTADSGLDYFITINQKRRAFPAMIEVHVEKPAPEL
ncbi:MAG TPA: V-type ATP synthase subunit I, partial [Parachlamydiales bacterium]|nr:V-type ATP synthase subunit I [Parachlamydiales bacterium]